jgi:hypothetical protein
MKKQNQKEQRETNLILVQIEIRYLFIANESLVCKQSHTITANAAAAAAVAVVVAAATGQKKKEKLVHLSNLQKKKKEKI